jgi:hypothetical protein
MAAAHFVKNGFSPSDAERPVAILQIAKWMKKFLEEGAGPGGESVDLRDAKKRAEEVYETVQQEINQAPTRLK